MARTRKITELQKRGIEMKLEPGVSDADIARELSVARGTVTRWWARPDIKKVLVDKRAAIEAAMPGTEEKADRWTRLARKAEEALDNILSGNRCWEGHTKDGDPFLYAASPSVVHSAARTVLAKIRPDLKAVELSGEVAQNHTGSVRQIVKMEPAEVKAARERLIAQGDQG